MSKPRYRWWPYVKAVIRAYPELRESVHSQLPAAGIANYSADSFKSGEGRALEFMAVKRLFDRDVAEYEAVKYAIRETANMETGEARLVIIDLVYWKRSHTLAGAGMQVGYSYRHTQRVNEQFAYLVAENLGLKEKMASQSQKRAYNSIMSKTDR